MYPSRRSVVFKTTPQLMRTKVMMMTFESRAAYHAKNKIVKNLPAHENRRETEDNPIDSDFEQTKIRITNIVYLHYCMITVEIISVDSP